MVCSNFVARDGFDRVVCICIFVSTMALCIYSTTLLSGFYVIFCAFSSWSTDVKKENTIILILQIRNGNAVTMRPRSLKK